MKNLAMTALATALAFATPAFADDAHHPEAAPGAKAVSTQPAAKNPAQTVQKMQDNVKKMQPQLDRIAKAKTDEERQKAMAEHMKTMQENMQMVRGMQADTMGCPMMEGGMMGKGGMGMMAHGAQPDGAPDHMQQMEKRMEMMQDMMKTMMERMPAPAAK
ncbi:hypothetical protein [Rhodoferax sp. UBA5149]|uniref:hypothetical protein n=1 Tax=Rhodoferax sp. UBA5149 TaxID=1947379 RepID=UPI0025E48E47|nr:hypothetical protein [Rhodoferax sp. UBA5149]